MANLPTRPASGNPNPCAGPDPRELREMARTVQRLGHRRLARRLFARAHNLTVGGAR